MRPDDAKEIVELANLVAGPGYYDDAGVAEMLERSMVTAETASLVALRRHALVGFRFTLPPGRWSRGRGAKLHVERWGAPLERAGYFQSSFVHPNHTGRGIGRRMAIIALDLLADMGAAVVVAHSWVQSPHQSSRRYLEGLDFRPVAECPEYWVDVDYHCPRCGRPCRCTAVEMVCRLGPGGTHR